MPVIEYSRFSGRIEIRLSSSPAFKGLIEITLQNWKTFDQKPAEPVSFNNQLINSTPFISILLSIVADLLLPLTLIILPPGFSFRDMVSK